MTFEEFIENYRPNKKCVCGGRLINDFGKAYYCDSCSYYVIGSKVITDCEGNLIHEYVTDDLIFYDRQYFKKVRKEANVGQLVFLDSPIKNKHIYKVKDYGGYETRTIKVSRDIDAMGYDKYWLLVPVCKGAK
jgi:hypothetical protein